MKVSYRLAQQSDINGIYNVEISSFLTPWLFESLLYDVCFNPVSIYFVALVDETVVGFCGAHVVKDEAHINNVAMLQQFRCKGMGQGLVEALMTQTKKTVKRFTLEVWQNNERAIKLYKKFGFVPVGVRKNYYEDMQEDAIIMAFERVD